MQTGGRSSFFRQVPSTKIDNPQPASVLELERIVKVNLSSSIEENMADVVGAIQVRAT